MGKAWEVIEIIVQPTQHCKPPLSVSTACSYCSYIQKQTGRAYYKLQSRTKHFNKSNENQKTMMSQIHLKFSFIDPEISTNKKYSTAYCRVWFLKIAVLKEELKWNWDRPVSNWIFLDYWIFEKNYQWNNR